MILTSDGTSNWGSYMASDQLCANIPSLKLTWHLKITHWKRRFLLDTIIFRCYVSFRECILVKLWYLQDWHRYLHKGIQFPRALHPRSTVMLKRYPWYSMMLYTFSYAKIPMYCQNIWNLSSHPWINDVGMNGNDHMPILLNLYANTRLANVRSRRSCDWALRRRHPQVFLWKHLSLELNRFKNHDVFYLLTIKIIKHVSKTLFCFTK